MWFQYRIGGIIFLLPAAQPACVGGEVMIHAESDT
jgi:hypothetical protein